MKKRLRLILPIAVGLVGLAIVPAYADGLLGGDNKVAGTNPNDLTNVVSKTLANTPLKQDQTSQYWTNERMQKAAPAGLPLPDGNPADGLLKNTLPAATGGLPTGGLPTGGNPVDAVKSKLPLANGSQPQQQPDGPVSSVPSKPAAKTPPPAKKTKATAAAPEWTAGGKTATTAGKVFFTIKGRDYVGSATVIKSKNKNLVVTAGHVVHEGISGGQGEFATNWSFAPGYSNGNAPYGMWTAKRLMATSSWVNNGSLNEDVGFAVLNKRGGKNIADVVGSQNIAFNSAKGKAVKAFGYPLHAPFTGKTLHYCSDTTRADTVDSKSTDVAIYCPMPEGASGGAWLTKLGGADTVVSVNSFSYDKSPDDMNGPNFNNNVRAVYNQAQNA